MKHTVLLPIAFAALLFSAAEAHAQTAPLFYEGQATTVHADTALRFTLSRGFVEAKTYKRCKAKDLPGAGSCTVYRTLDGLIFKVMEQKKGIGIFFSAQVTYYLKDENPFQGTVYYKLVHVNGSNTYQACEKIAVLKEEEFWSKINK